MNKECVNVIKGLLLGLCLLVGGKGLAQKVPDKSLSATLVTQHLSRAYLYSRAYGESPYQQWGYGADINFENRFNSWLAFRLGMRYVRHGEQEGFFPQKIEQLNVTAAPLFVHSLEKWEWYAGPGLGLGLIFQKFRNSLDRDAVMQREQYVAANLRFSVGAHIALDRMNEHRLNVQLYIDYQSNQIFELGKWNIVPRYEMTSYGMGVGYRFNFY